MLSLPVWNKKQHYIRIVISIYVFNFIFVIFLAHSHSLSSTFIYTDEVSFTKRGKECLLVARDTSVQHRHSGNVCF